MDAIENKQENARSWTGCLLIALTLLLLPFGGLCFLAGGAYWTQRLYDRWTQEKIEALEPLLVDPRFSHLRIDHSSAAQVYFADAEISEEDFAALKQEVTQLLGRDEAEKVLYLLQWSVNERAGRALYDDGEEGSP